MSEREGKGDKVAISVLDEQKCPECVGQVVDLWRKHSSTLGFFPEGAFSEYVAKKQVIIAVCESNKIIGYVLYRVSKQKVFLTHLCIDMNYRGEGISRKLIRKLESETAGLKGVGLYCRRDYAVNTLWPKLGFSPVDEKCGRGRDREALTFWWLDYRNPTLFDELIAGELRNKSKVVIDANIFFDLDPDNTKNESVESKSLEADWFVAEAALYVTDEIYNEVNRKESARERARQRKRTHKYYLLETNKSLVNEIRVSLEGILGVPRNRQDLSDQVQLSHAIVGGAEYFVTRDDGLLKRSDALYDKYGVNIVRPAEIIIDVDNLYDELSYRPARLAGTLLPLRRIQSEEVKSVIDEFCLSGIGEKKRILRAKLSMLLSQTNICKVYIVEGVDGEKVAVFGVGSLGGNIFNVSFLRVKKHSIAPTLSRYLLVYFLREAISNRCDAVTVSDEYIQDVFYEALKDEGFIRAENSWVKLMVNRQLSMKSLEKSINDGGLLRQKKLDKYCCSYISKAIDIANASKDRYALCELESLIWPGKIIDGEMPCFIVPIKAWWARELFDENLANEDLFGGDINLALQNEGVYYYSVRGAKTSAPARILWYVSQDKKIPGTSAIRACSVLKEVTIDTPKNLFIKYRRLGVYKWGDVLKTANDQLSNKVVALHFGQTELFHKPVGWEVIQNQLLPLSVNRSLISATPIPTNIYMNIYKMGMTSG